MKQNRLQVNASAKRQRGVALAISLVLLVAMTILGVATLSGTRLNEKITSNAQQKSIAFEVAESGINSVWSRSKLEDEMKRSDVDFNDPPPIPQPAVDALLSTALDQTRNAALSVNLDAAVTVQYCGEGPPLASDLSADKSGAQNASMYVDVNAIASIANSHTRANHVQRARIPSLATGRTAVCVTPGL